MFGTSWFSGGQSIQRMDQVRGDKETPALANPFSHGKGATAAERFGIRTQKRLANPAAQFRTRLSDPLEDVFMALKDQAQRTRGKGIDAQRRRVVQVLDSMSLKDQARALAERVQGQRLSKHRISAMSQYTEFCAGKGSGPVLPVTKELALAFVTWSVFKKKPTQSHALDKRLSNLRVAAQAMNQWSVSAEDSKDINRMVGILQATLPSQPKISVGSAARLVVLACSRLRSIGTLKALHARALLATAMGCLARGTELTGALGMRWGDLLLDHRGLTFRASFTKTGKRSLATRDRLFPHVTKGLEELCPTRCLLDFKAAWAAGGGDVRDHAMVWMRLTRSASRPTIVPLTLSEAVAIVREEMVLVGEDPAVVDAHWGRHTGRGLLERSLGFGPLGADLMGDWKPARQGREGKSVGQKHYAHPTVEESWEAAMTYAPKGYEPVCCAHLRGASSRRSGGL